MKIIPGVLAALLLTTGAFVLAGLGVALLVAGALAVIVDHRMP